MIAKERSLIHIRNSINLLNKIFLLLLLCAFALLLFNLLAPESDKSAGLVPKVPDKRVSDLDCNYEKIGEGALAFDSELQSFPFPDLSDKVLFLSRSSRPDSDLKEIQVLLGLKGSQEKKAVTSGEKLYLTYDKDHLIFSEGTSPLWICPKISHEGPATLQMGIDLISDRGVVLLSKMRETAFQPDWKPLKKDQVHHEGLLAGIQSFDGARWWSPDRLFDRYAGDEYQVFAGLERLEILGEKVLFAAAGKTFMWREGQWEDGNEEGFPLARVLEITPYKMDWELWDPSGLEWVVMTFHPERARPISVRMEEVLTRLRQRTSSRISCRIDNRATILRAGDWLFRTDRGWQTVKNSYEIDAILKFKVQGELFIFDGLEKHDGKEVFCGTLFDSMRTELQSVRLPISQMKTLKHSPPTKKGISTKIQSPSSSKIERSPPKPKVHQKLKPIEDYEIFDE